jgi:hypothetical protein
MVLQPAMMINLDAYLPVTSIQALIIVQQNGIKPPAAKTIAKINTSFRQLRLLSRQRKTARENSLLIIFSLDGGYPDKSPGSGIIHSSRD